MRRFMSVATLVTGALLYPAGSGAGAPLARTGVDAVPVAVSLHGSIVVFAAHGGSRVNVTDSGQDHAPVVASDGKAIAFSRGGNLPLRVTRRRILVARLGSNGVWHVMQFSRPAWTAGALQPALAWAPGSDALAWFDGASVQYRHFGGQQRTVLRLGSTVPNDQTLSIAVSRDGGGIAATMPQAESHIPSALKVVVGRLGAPRQRMVTITFRSGLLIGPNGRGSMPVTDDLVYTTSQLAPRGHTLEFPTVAAPGIGRQMTGVFLVPDTGGRAWLVQGNGHGLHGIRPFGYGMEGATHFELAPNGRYTATDPTGGFYVAGDIGPLHVSAPVSLGCVISQWTWLADSVRLSYVTLCSVPGSSPLRVRLTLATVSIYGGAPIVLYRTDSSDPNAVDLAQAYRCIACG